MYEIRNASGLYTASSTFNANLATTAGAALYLVGSSSSTDPTVITVATGTIRIQQGLRAPVALNSIDSYAEQLIFLNHSTSTATNIGLTLTMKAAATSTRQEYNASTTIATSVELRSK